MPLADVQIVATRESLCDMHNRMPIGVINKRVPLRYYLCEAHITQVKEALRWQQAPKPQS
jgi:hypothetical protein